ncbi:MAG: nucleotide exchange factor GrpE [Clostridiales bacterium]|nr:nucleotide exchange factor GrpE [Clostridiales bacterium]
MAKKKEEKIPVEEVINETVEETTAEETVKETPVEVDEATKLIEELSDTKDKYLRLAAEYDNFRKRSQRERDSIYNDAVAATVKQFIPVLDNLERALAATSDEATRKGIELTHKQFIDTLAKLGVKEIPALGETFDPNVHNAVMHIEDETIDEHTVIEVFEKGYIMGDRVIRYSMVKVAN